MIEFHAKDLQQIVVPIRFTRAITGFSRRSAPEVDDRGFAMGTRPPGWSSTTAYGPMVGLMVNSEMRIKVEREDIDAEAPLYVTCTEPSVLRIVAPTDGGPLPDDGVLTVRGLTARGSPGRIEVRLGSTIGPILGRLEPHVFGAYRIPVQAHRVRCDTATATGIRPNLPVERILRRVRAIWWPCGIHVVYDAASRPVIDTDVVRVATLNQVNLGSGAEVASVFGLQRARLGLPAGTNDQAVNWYIIPRFTNANTVGLGRSRVRANSVGTDTGVITTADGVTNDTEIERVARTLAHEIGHFLRLPHVQQRNADNPVRDTFGRRQLMYPISWLENAVGGAGLLTVPRTNNVGYGHTVRGCLITMKNHAHHSTDGECGTARSTYRSGAWY
ncbi:MAG: hypothetical protein JXQ29_15405 [Planctomycetes bacterium]|nr:hypothetical protein [Planctomycetota bacterium]